MELLWFSYFLQLKYPFTIAGYSRTITPAVLIKIKYQGLTGYGEASLPQYLGETQETVINFLKKIKLDKFASPFDIENIMEYIDNIESGNTAAKASVDIALHDLKGKLMEKPVHSFWDLDKQKAPYTTYTIGIDKPEIIKKKTKEVASGFKILKIKLDGKNDKKIVEAVRSVTNHPFAVDANQAWTDKEYALEISHWLKEKGCLFIEQPMDKDKPDENAWITQQDILPVYADESVQRLKDLYRLKGAFSGINIKLMKCTGINEAYKILQLAPQLGFETMLGCMTETSCAISAAAQLSPLVEFADLDGNLLITNDCFHGIKIMNGKINLTDSPGIGVELLREIQ